MYNNMVNVLYDCSKPYFKHKSKVNNIKPGWSEYVAEYHAETREASKLWQADQDKDRSLSILYFTFLYMYMSLKGN